MPPLPDESGVRNRNCERTWLYLFLGIGVVHHLAVHFLYEKIFVLFLDYSVYAEGARRMFSGKSLYDHVPGELPYTYPPVSAYVMAPFTVLPQLTGGFVLYVASLVALWRVTTLISRQVLPLTATSDKTTQQWQHIARWLIYLAPFIILVPLMRNLEYGQINLLLLWLVTEDLLGRSAHSKYRGVLIGLAAAVKLTPIVFALVLLFSLRRRTGLVALATFVGLSVSPFIFHRADAATYWFRLITDETRIGSVEYISNQSLNGLIWRVLGTEGNSVLWLLVSAGLGLLTLVVARTWLHQNAPVLALAAISLTMLLTSPISWMHHWVWATPAVTVLWVGALRLICTESAPLRRFGNGRVFAIIGCVVIFAVVDPKFFPHGNNNEFLYNGWQLVASSGYLIIALGFLATMAWAQLRTRQQQHVVQYLGVAPTLSDTAPSR